MSDKPVNNRPQINIVRLDKEPTLRSRNKFDCKESDRVLKSLTTGRRAVGTTSPQFKSAVKTLDRFIEELQKSAPVSTLASTQQLS